MENNTSKTTIHLSDIASIVYPARDLTKGIETWSALLGSNPVFQNEDFASFPISGQAISLSRLPWVEYPLIFWKVEDIEKAHAHFIAQGAKAMVEIDGGSLAELGSKKALAGNQDGATGIVDMPGARLAVLKAADGNLIALSQEVTIDGREVH